MLKPSILILITLPWCSSIESQVIQKIEPPNWWVGMKDSSLQIMIYGENVGQLDVDIKYPGLTLQPASQTPSANYKFIDLVIKESCKPGQVYIHLTGKEGKVINIAYDLFERKTSSSSRKGFDNSDVVYLITPDRFANGDPSNDNMPGYEDTANRSEPFGRHGGDIQGIIDNLDYIKSMGFTALWLNPVLENNMPRHSYHGYAITNFYKTDPRFGDNELYRLLCQEASKRNIKVIMDMVVNHCGLHHWWIIDPPFPGWINFPQKPYIQTNHRKTLNSDPYASKEDMEIMTGGWFVRTMPDLNVTHHYMSKYLIQNTLWWIEYAGLSGIRMDTYPYPDEGFMARWAKSVMDEYPQFNIVGEIWYGDPDVISYWQQGKENDNGYNSYLPSLCDFPIQSALTKSITASSGWEDDWMPLYEMLARDFNYPDPENMLVFTDNHDMSRIYTQVDEDFSKYQMALTYILTTRGIPQIFYGTEILAGNKGTDNHGVIRSDFPGGWLDDEKSGFTGKALSTQQLEAQEFLKTLLNWRQKSEAVHHGKLMHFAPEKDIYVFFRYDDSDLIMVILNKNADPVVLDLDRFRSVLKGRNSGENVLTGEMLQLEKEFLLSGPGPMIIEIH